MLTGSRGAQPLRQRRVRPRFWLLDFYGSAIGKKAVMAITGIMLLGFVLAHMLGNLHMYQDAAHMNHYGEYLRTIGEPILPHTGFLWILRVGLILAFVVHVYAAFALWAPLHGHVCFDVADASSLVESALAVADRDEEDAASVRVPWPDVDRTHLWAAVEEYARRTRRYGSA